MVLGQQWGHVDLTLLDLPKVRLSSSGIKQLCHADLKYIWVNLTSKLGNIHVNLLNSICWWTEHHCSSMTTLENHTVIYTIRERDSSERRRYMKCVSKHFMGFLKMSFIESSPLSEPQSDPNCFSNFTAEVLPCYFIFLLYSFGFASLYFFSVNVFQIIISCNKSYFPSYFLHMYMLCEWWNTKKKTGNSTESQMQHRVPHVVQMNNYK